MIKLAKQLPFTAAFLLICYFGYGQTTDSSTIIIKAVNKDKPSNIYLNYTVEGSSFGRNASRNLTSVSEQGEVIRVKTSIPLLFDLFGNLRQIASGIVYPGDSISITCDYKNEKPFTFEGKSALACQYYSLVKNKYGLNYLVNSADISSDDFMEYFYKLEEKYKQWDSVFNALQGNEKYPEWFLAYKRAGSVYDKPDEMLNAIHQHNSLRTDKIYANPEFLLWFRDVPLNDAKAFNNSSYFKFLWQYFLWKSKVSCVVGSNQKIDVHWVSKILPDVKKELNDVTREWFLTKVLVIYYNVNDVKQVDSAFALVKPLIKSPHYLEELDVARERSVELRKMRFAKSAKVGAKAPGFYLKDSMNVNYSVERFSGQWVLMGFYNSSGFANNNFMEIRDSVSRSKEALQLVNIYIDYDAAYWKNNIDKYPNSGLHLFSKGNWGEMLTYLYGLESFPYYVLVDPEGIIRYSREGNFADAFAMIKNE